MPFREERRKQFQANRRLRLRELHKTIPGMSMTTLHECVTVTLGYHKLCASWVSKMLTEEHKKKRMGFALDFLTRYAKTGDEFLNHIVTGDEMWVYHPTPESKQTAQAVVRCQSPENQEIQNFNF
ncbi:hypothetical protein AVEN_274346-1 [Araneus ventricosus]|uniref:Mariner Mos1 transposase n=1 Tax=Araneus ventricosus TaxID=182803 RepID=A0A4Y2GA75_ARAVE|nr:hypothetical protein AVEN_274346-1 [Araneus ventricosus]